MGNDTTSATSLARRTAHRLAASADPSLPGRVERVLTSAQQDGTDADPLDGADLASFLVVAAGVACRIERALRARTDTPSVLFIERRLLSEMGVDAGMACDREVIIEALAAEVVAVGGEDNEGETTGSR